MIASRLMSRSPVWLRKIPSTVSGSQGSRRGLRPAVRFAFPLGARLNITLRARPCQELFSESFWRPSRGPRGASRLPGLGPSRRRVRYYTRPRRGAGGKRSRTQDADNSIAVERRGTEGIPGGREPPSWRFAPAHRRDRPGGAALTRGPPLGDRPWSILSAPRRFRLLQYRYGLGTTRIRALKHFRRVRF